jgi:SPP1 family phage portal protein
MVSLGRKRIIIEKEITRDNLIDVLIKAMSIHNDNVQDCKFLIDYCKGKQPILDRLSADAGYNSSINNKTVINYAWSSVRDIVGYTFGTNIQYNPTTGDYRKDIDEIARILNYEGNSLADHESSTFASICGVGYLCMLPSDELLSDYMPDIPLIDASLDPLKTFCIQSARVGNPTLMSVTYYDDEEYTYFSCYTDTDIYYIKCKGVGTLLKGQEMQIAWQRNPIGLNPITMVQNNAFLMGDFEVAIGVLDAINQLASDTLNDVENVIKSLLVVINAELTDDTVSQVKKNRILELVGGENNNKIPDAKFIYQQLDAAGMENIREYLEEAYKQIIGIPDRKTRGGGGGDTGDAVKLRDGWADIEIVARIKEQYFKVAKMKQLAVAVRILQKLNIINNDFRLKYIEIKVPRNKVDNLQTKAQAYSTLIGTKTLLPADALTIVDVTTDADTKCEKGRIYWEEQAEKEAELNKRYSNTENTDTDVKTGQEQKNQYNTDITETKARKDSIKEEIKNSKRERIY